MWAVFTGGRRIAANDVEAAVPQVHNKVADTGVTVRGYYDLTGYRADADLMAWFIADTPEPLQAAYRALALSDLELTPVWSVIAQHKPAEFNKSHLPGMFRRIKRQHMQQCIRLCAPMTGTCWSRGNAPQS